MKIQFQEIQSQALQEKIGTWWPCQPISKSSNL